MPWMGPMETPIGLMATAGISPRPTEAPGLNGIPKELKPRQQALAYPPPVEWCGLIEGLTDDILTCNAGFTCINHLNAVGCCPSLNGACTNLYTTCANYRDTCNSACQADVSIVKCSDAAFPYCGTYSFFGDTFLYNCQSTSMFPLSVEFLGDYYSTAIGSTFSLAPASFSSQSQATGATESASSATSASRSTHSHTVGSSASTSSSIAESSSNNSTGLAQAAIDGIAAGVSLLVCVVAGVIVFFCLRSRKRKRLAASQAIASHAPPTYQPPPMQQHQTGYQTVPQQDTQFQGSPNYQPTQAGYYGGPSDPQKTEGAYSHVSPVGSPSPSAAEPRPFSVVSTQPTIDQRPMNLSPPLTGARPSGGAAQEYYKQPVSPTVTEVDGTQGNPGVPHGRQQGVLEVDGTSGNPGVPYDQHYHGPYEMH